MNLSERINRIAGAYKTHREKEVRSAIWKLILGSPVTVLIIGGAILLFFQQMGASDGVLLAMFFGMGLVGVPLYYAYLQKEQPVSLGNLLSKVLVVPGIARESIGPGEYIIGAEVGQPERFVKNLTPHTIILAPPGVGKSQTMMTALHLWSEDAVVVDPKGEFYASRGGTPWDFSRPTTPLPLAPLWGGAPEALLRIGLNSPGAEDPRSQPFIVPYANLLKAAGMYLEAQGHSPWAVLAMGPADLQNLFRRALKEEGPWQIPAQTVRVAAGGAYLSSILAQHTFFGELQGWTGAFSAGDGVEELLPGQHFLIMPPNPSPGLASLLKTVVEGWIKWIVNHPPKKPLFFLVDEAAVIRPQGLEEALAFLRGYGVRMVVVAQSYAQLEKVYRSQGAQGIVQNGTLVIYGSPQDKWAQDQVARALEGVINEVAIRTILPNTVGGAFSSDGAAAQRLQSQQARDQMLAEQKRILNRSPGWLLARSQTGGLEVGMLSPAPMHSYPQFSHRGVSLQREEIPPLEPVKFTPETTVRRVRKAKSDDQKPKNPNDDPDRDLLLF